MASEGFSLPGSGYDELTKIMQAHKAAGDESGLDEVAAYAAVNRSTVSRNNAFLFEIEFLEGTTQKRRISETGRQLAQALEHGMDVEVVKGWRALVSTNPFMTKLISAVRIRGGMNEDDLYSHIAFTSGRPKGKVTSTGARTVAAILEKARLIDGRDGEYHAVSRGGETEDTHLGGDDTIPTTAVKVTRTTRPDPAGGLWRSVLESQRAPEAAAPAGPLSIRLDIRVNVEPKDLPGLGRQIRHLMNELAEAPPSDETQDE